MAKDHTGKCFLLDVTQRSALDLREVAHLRLGELDIIAIPTVELDRHGMNSGIAVALNPSNCVLDRPTDADVNLTPFRIIQAALEPSDHRFPHVGFFSIDESISYRFKPVNTARKRALNAHRRILQIGDVYCRQPRKSLARPH